MTRPKLKMVLPPVRVAITLHEAFVCAREAREQTHTEAVEDALRLYVKKARRAQ